MHNRKCDQVLVLSLQSQILGGSRVASARRVASSDGNVAENLLAVRPIARKKLEHGGDREGQSAGLLTLSHDHPRREPLGDESQDTRGRLLGGSSRSNTENTVLRDSPAALLWSAGVRQTVLF
jgi:hypothetical protein